MNSFTHKSEFLEKAEFILDNSDLLAQDDCLIVGEVLYERLDEGEHKWRFFFSVDDYDYLVDDPKLEAGLESLFTLKHELAQYLKSKE